MPRRSARSDDDVRTKAQQNLAANLARLIPPGAVDAAADGTGINRSTIYKWLRGQQQPGAADLAVLAGYLGVTVSQLLDDKPVPRASPYDRDSTIREMANLLASLAEPGDRRELVRHVRWLAEKLPRVASGGETPQDAEPELPANVARLPERTVPKWTPEFPVDPSEFVDGGDTDYPLEFHAFEVEDLDVAAGVTGIETDMPTHLLSSKQLREIREIRDPKLRVVRVRGDSMSPEFEEGWKLAVDVTQQNPSLLPEGEPVVVYRQGAGIILGWWRPQAGGRVLLEKENKRYGPIELQEGDRLVGPVAFVAWKPKRRKVFTK